MEARSPLSQNPMQCQPQANGVAALPQHTAHRTQHIAHRTQQTADSTQHIAHSTQQTADSTQHIAHSTQHTCEPLLLQAPHTLLLLGTATGLRSRSAPRKGADRTRQSAEGPAQPFYPQRPCPRQTSFPLSYLSYVSHLSDPFCLPPSPPLPHHLLPLSRGQTCSIHVLWTWGRRGLTQGLTNSLTRRPWSWGLRGMATAKPTAAAIPLNE